MQLANKSMEDVNPDPGLIDKHPNQSEIATKSSPEVLLKKDSMKSQLAEQMQKLQQQKLILMQQKEEAQRKMGMQTMSMVELKDNGMTIHDFVDQNIKAKEGVAMHRTLVQ